VIKWLKSLYSSSSEEGISGLTVLFSDRADSSIRIIFDNNPVLFRDPRTELDQVIDPINENHHYVSHRWTQFMNLILQASNCAIVGHSTPLDEDKNN
jgi:hypothetical protein